MKPRFWTENRPLQEPKIVDIIVMDEDYTIFGLVGLDLNKASVADFINDMPIGTTISII